MSVGNPNHPVVQQLEHEWHKLCAILLAKFGLEAIEITSQDIAALPPGAAICADTRGGRFFLRLVSREQAEQLAREEGGLAH